MGRLGLAIKILFSGETAKQVTRLLEADNPRAALPEPEPPPPEPPTPARSEAVSLLSSLQREARFVDFIQETIDGYSDAQVGAAVREIHKGCRDVLDRMFSLSPVIDQPEDSDVSVEDPSSGQFRLTGNIGQSPGAVSGKLVHHGWVAQKCDVPLWSGNTASVNIVAAAEIQVS